MLVEGGRAAFPIRELLGRQVGGAHGAMRKVVAVARETASRSERCVCPT